MDLQSPLRISWSTRNSIILNLVHVIDLVSGKINSEDLKKLIICECARLKGLLSLDKRNEHPNQINEYNYQDDTFFNIPTDLRNSLATFFKDMQTLANNSTKLHHSQYNCTLAGQVGDLVFDLTSLKAEKLNGSIDKTATAFSSKKISNAIPSKDFYESISSFCSTDFTDSSSGKKILGHKFKNLLINIL